MPISGQTQHLYVKSFFAESVAQAMQEARNELGPDALLLKTRDAPPEARHLGNLEVVFGSCARPTTVASPSSSADGLEDIRLRIHAMIDRIAPRFRHCRSGTAERLLIAAGVEPDLAREIDDAVRQRAGKRPVRDIAAPRQAYELEPQDLAADLIAEIEGRIEVQPELRMITALVGPPGSGKTTTLVKLAISQGLAAGRRVRLISADTQRVGGAEQLRTYASVLGVAFEAVESTAALAQAINASPADALLLIDTPGYSVGLLSELGADLASFLANRQDIDTHLVLTASMRPASLRSVAAAYAIFQPRKLLFTRLDEATSYAPAFCEAARQALPLSFFCHGQDIPEDIAPAVKQKVSASLVRQLPESLAAVA